MQVGKAVQPQQTVAMIYLKLMVVVVVVAVARVPVVRMAGLAGSA